MTMDNTENSRPPANPPFAALAGSASGCVCKKCGQPMVGYPGDDECSDCAFPMLKQASDAAARAVEEAHYERTGERKTCGELLRKTLGM